MTARQKIKVCCFTLEGTNSFATVLFFNYLYFYMAQYFGYGDKRNFALAAFLGVGYTFAAWQGGKFAQRYGYFPALKTGFSLMLAGLVSGLVFPSAAGKIAAAVFVTTGTCFIWPTLEAFVTDGESATRLPRMVGIYNITWAVANASA
jgi:predicted MFS family arabinose efflux permease